MWSEDWIDETHIDSQDICSYLQKFQINWKRICRTWKKLWSHILSFGIFFLNKARMIISMDLFEVEFLSNWISKVGLPFVIILSDGNFRTTKKFKKYHSSIEKVPGYLCGKLTLSKVISFNSCQQSLDLDVPLTSTCKVVYQ